MASFRKNLINSSAEPLPKIEISSLVSYNGEVILSDLKKIKVNWILIFNFNWIQGLRNLLNGKSFKEPLFIDYDKKLNKVVFNGLDMETYQNQLQK